MKLNGFEAISYYNGWAQAITGALIVMSGLSILSFLISQLHKIIYFMENFRKKRKTVHKSKVIGNVVPDFLNADINQLGELSRPYVEELEEFFQLRDLYDVFMQNNLPHPHLTIRSLRESGRIIPLGDGLFCWKR